MPAAVPVNDAVSLTVPAYDMIRNAATSDVEVRLLVDQLSVGLTAVLLATVRLYDTSEAVELSGALNDWSTLNGAEIPWDATPPVMMSSFDAVGLNAVCADPLLFNIKVPVTCHASCLSTQFGANTGNEPTLLWNSYPYSVQTPACPVACQEL